MFRKVHQIAGVVVGSFVILHLFNHLFSLQGIDAHIKWMSRLRFIYRNPVAEVLLILSILIQIISGVKMLRKQRQPPHGFFDKLHRNSGIYLAAFFYVHLSAIAAGRYLLGLDTNYYFGAAGINTFPYNLFFIPYYTLAIVSFFAHMASIHSRKMKWHVFGMSPRHQAHTILIIGCLVAGLVMYGFTNSYRGVSLPPDYNIDLLLHADNS